MNIPNKYKYTKVDLGKLYLDDKEFIQTLSRLTKRVWPPLCKQNKSKQKTPFLQVSSYQILKHSDIPSWL